MSTVRTSGDKALLLVRTARDFADFLESRSDTVIELLLSYESYETAKDELKRSLSCLRNLDQEFPYLGVQVARVSSFLPLNQPLYSLVLFAIVPSHMVLEHVFVRPPVVAWAIVQALSDLLGLKKTFPQIRLVTIERRDFIELYVKNSSAVLFVGKHSNALKVSEACPRNALFVFTGGGVNPFLVGADADLDLAADKVSETKIYNSGQDCAAPDAVLVHSQIADRFLHKLIDRISTIGVGEYSDRQNRVGALVDHDALVESVEFLRKHRKNIVYGGLVDARRNIVYPAIVRAVLREQRFYKELYAPIFFVAQFESNIDLAMYFDDPRYFEHAMYASVFGSVPYLDQIKNTVVLREKSVLDIEQGNKPFGGFGPRANFVSSKGKVVARPVLISREIWHHVQNKAVGSASE